MGGIAGVFGLGGGAAGTGFNGPQFAPNLTNPTTPDQISGAYNSNQNSLAQQQALLQALQGQGGLGNQSQVYGQLQDVVAGRGPNPAQAMLNQATGQNVANQAALMAGQRGAGANVGLLARQAGQQGANLQQQAVGQGASMQAQQSLGALNTAGQLANTQAGQQIGQTNANTSAQQAEQMALLNAQAQYNNAQVGMQSNINSSNAGLINTQLQGQHQVLGGVMNGLGAAIGMAGGGPVERFDAGGVTGYSLGANTSLPTPQSPFGPQSQFGNFLNKVAAPQPIDTKQEQSQPQGAPLEKGMSNLVESLGSVIAGANGGNVGGKLKSGGKVPGKPQVPGPVNSYKNDNVKALLSPGEIVLPRTVTQSADPVTEAAKFVANVISKRKGQQS